MWWLKCVLAVSLAWGVAASHATQPMTIDISDSESECDSVDGPFLFRRRASVIASEYLGIYPDEYRRLKRWKFPQIGFDIMHATLVLFGVQDRNVEVIEWFCGVGHVAQGCSENSLAALGYDRDRSAQQDMLTDDGFLLALVLVLSLARFGTQHFATVCSSWVWMAWDKTGRSIATPMGLSRPSTRRGNLMVTRACILGLIGLSRKAAYVLEQPSSSLMFNHTRQSQEPSSLFWKIYTWMLAFGGLTPKRTTLQLDQPLFAAELGRKLRRSEFLGTKRRTYTLKDADATHPQMRIYGAGKKIKQIQEYPIGYGRAVGRVARKWRDYKLATETECVDSDSDYELAHADNWPDAKLGSLLKSLDAQMRAPRRGHF